MFDMEYARWLEEDNHHMSELRAGLQARLLDGDLRVLVDECLAHYDEVFRLKGMAAASDAFHLITGTWTTPAERCFLWIGGFRPSEMLKMFPCTSSSFCSVVLPEHVHIYCSVILCKLQADNLRQQTLHQMRRILTIRQTARCFLAIGEYYRRLRALSTLWASRPRE
ncbi:hypothetical protein Taro_041508 [Colocasia esculenta]|uniref:DOG1 domain-containing protein n=1 Tax=Colocasia esculenta TaxID=4460 RepID=A0A843WLM8_COLES|nr:hypothetical protein [Colocasia esculenta]